MTLRVTEFTFRRDQNDTVGMHVILSEGGTDAFGRPNPDGPVMTLLQAADAGFGLPEVLADINSASAVALDAARATIARNEAVIDSLQQQLDAVAQEAVAEEGGGD